LTATEGVFDVPFTLSQEEVNSIGAVVECAAKLPQLPPEWNVR